MFCSSFFFHVILPVPVNVSAKQQLLAAQIEMALYNKIAIVTGAAIGIGKAITEILLKNGVGKVFSSCNQ